MLFNSYSFLFAFLPATFFSALLVRRLFGTSAEMAVLAAASLAFYSFSGTQAIVTLIASLCMNYTFGQLIRKSTGRIRATITLTGIALDLAILGYFKYFNFFIDQWNFLGGSINIAEIALPAGVSFYTFTQIAYLADTYLARKASSGFVSYILFVTFFPHLIAGPIVHHSEMMPQFDRRRPPSANCIAAGITIFTIGLAKKIFLADKLALFVKPVFGTAVASSPDMATAWLAASCYTMQIYFDFSAYSDMAIGLGKMFGIRFPYNFASPYKSTSIIEFWRRWHITLSRFLRDYIYIPLGGNRASAARQKLNVLLTMVIGGLWHGAGWNFIVWGALHGIALLFNHWWRGRVRRPVFAPLAWLITFVFIIFAWVPFRAETLDATLSIWRGMVGMNGFTWNGEVSLPKYVINFWLPIAAAIALFAPNSQQIMRYSKPGLRTAGYPSPFLVKGAWPEFTAISWKPHPVSALLTALALSAAILSLKDISEFIYFRF